MRLEQASDSNVPVEKIESTSIPILIGTIREKAFPEPNTLWTDVFLTNAPGRPKYAIAEQVREHYDYVPRVFWSIGETLSLPIEECEAFIIRSEHPQDYAGRSWLLPSWTVIRRNHGFDVINEISGKRDIKYGRAWGNQFELQTFQTRWSHGSVIHYGDLGVLLDDYLWTLEDFSEIHSIDANFASYSVWEYVTGKNYAIVADNGAYGKYHIYGPDGTACVYDAVAENTPSLHEELVRNYEHIRKTKWFDPLHCPIMEFQHGKRVGIAREILEGKREDGGNHWYFLQYHRTRGMELANFTLENPPSSDITVPYVRWTTPLEGMVIDFAHYENTTGSNGAFLVTHSGRINEDSLEKLASQRDIALCLIASPFSLKARNNDVLKTLSDHVGRSIAHKPPLSIMLFREELMRICPDFERWFRLRIVSDGKKAYARKI